MSTSGVKTESELRFYFWTGAGLYGVWFLLYIVDFWQRWGWDPTGCTLLVLLLLIDIFLIHQVRGLKNWARMIFLFKFVCLAFAFYPQTLFLKSGSWMYSHHFPHGVFQRILNHTLFAYELFFCVFLLKRSVRFEFSHR